MLLIVAVWSFTLSQIEFERKAAVEEAFGNSTGIVRAFEEYVRFTIQTTDYFAAFVREEYAAEGGITPNIRRILERSGQLPYIRYAAVLDENANTVYSSPPNIILGHYAIFQAYTAHSNSDDWGLRFGQTVDGLVYDNPGIPVSRRINKPDGSFGGMVVFIINPAYFSQFSQFSGMTDKHLLLLASRDGYVLLRRQGSQISFGQDIRDDLLFRQLRESVASSYLGTGLLEDVPRMFSYRLLVGYPLVVSVGLEEKAAMANFNERRGTYILLSGIFSFLVVGVFLPLMGLIRRQQRTGAELTDKVATLIRAQKEIERYSDIAYNMQVGLNVYHLDDPEDDRSLRLVLANPASSWQFGMETADMLGRTIDELFPNLRANGVPQICAEIVKTGMPRTLGDFCYQDSKIEESWFSVKVFALPDQCAGILFENITSRKQMETQLAFIGYHDALTGLYNRAFFEEELRRLDLRRSGMVGLIMFDVDGLKLVNDTMGHASGDNLLVGTAEVLRGIFRNPDLVARIGGDEFAVVMQNITSEGMQHCCERVRDANIQVVIEGRPTVLSLSMGYAISAGPEEPMNGVFREADNNMYRDKLHRKQSVRSAIVETLKGLLSARDFITEGHAERLQSLVRRMAETLKLTGSRVSDLVLLAQFHDIGKVGIPDRILMKQGPLTPEEREEMKRHCEIGYRVALSSPELSPIAEWILRHQEWWNGGGYPFGISAEEIPLECRILSIADAFDAMTSDRPYRKAMEEPAALAELQRCAGTQFDPELVALFIRENVFDQDHQID